MNTVGKLVTTNEKAEVLTTFLPQSSLATSLPTPLEWLDCKTGTEGAKALPLEDQVHDHLRNLNIHESMGPEEMHPRVLRELADVVAKPLSMIFEKSWQSGEAPGDWKKGNIAPIFKKDPPRSYARAHGGQGGDLRQPAWLHQGQWTREELTDVIYLDFCKAFDMVPQNILVSKMERDGFDVWTTRWMTNWLDDLIWRVVVNGSTYRWRSVTSGVPQGSVLGRVLFNIFINDIDSGIECTLSRFADDAKLNGDAIQRDLDKLEEWADVNLMRFNKAKCRVLHLGQGNPLYQYKLEDEGIESSLVEKGLGVLMDEKLDMNQQCVLAAQKANHILGCIKRSVARRPHLEYCVQLWSPQHKKDMDLLEQDRLRELGLFSLEKRRLRGDLIIAFQSLKEVYKKDVDRLFGRACCNRTRGNGFKLKQNRFRLDIRKKFFTTRVDRLPREVVEAPSLETFKAKLDGALSNLIFMIKTNSLPQPTGAGRVSEQLCGAWLLTGPKPRQTVKFGNETGNQEWTLKVEM
ncbi:LOW QUALITY PROTEIN: hypothetical protein QYF61_015140, partial [Mycteria americana]